MVWLLGAGAICRRGAGARGERKRGIGRPGPKEEGPMLLHYLPPPCSVFSSAFLQVMLWHFLPGYVVMVCVAEVIVDIYMVYVEAIIHMDKMVVMGDALLVVTGAW
jgi:hypothetical protein